MDWQHQLYSLLTNQPGACAHYRQHQTVTNEQWLLVVQIAYRADQQPAPFATGTYQIGVQVTDPSGDATDGVRHLPVARRHQLLPRP